MKHFKRAVRFGAKVPTAVGALLLPALSFAGAAGPYDAITDAVDFADVVTAMGVIAAAVALALIAKKGFRLVMGMLGS